MRTRQLDSNPYATASNPFSGGAARTLVPKPLAAALVAGLSGVLSVWLHPN